MPIRSIETDYIVIVAAVAIIGFLWNLQREMRAQSDRTHRDIADLRERMARLEGLFEGFTKRETA